MGSWAQQNPQGLVFAASFDCWRNSACVASSSGFFGLTHETVDWKSYCYSASDAFSYFHQRTEISTCGSFQISKMMTSSATSVVTCPSLGGANSPKKSYYAFSFFF
uniref:Uncharacterized protein n=1 Tax=Strombidium inclinatum TaxID=197538 RepID=A0A7S3N2S7_9SPIT|mmetsp:Transcript_42749/g.65698  ORF Transcript_42749/g.65698 Transcript_42749/m.65698 type:complete len:106 (+) Transcript_42749:172-489(+)